MDNRHGCTRLSKPILAGATAAVFFAYQPPASAQQITVNPVGTSAAAARFRHDLKGDSSGTTYFVLPVGGTATSILAGVETCIDSTIYQNPLDVAMQYVSVGLPSSITGETFNPNPSDQDWQEGFIVTSATATASLTAKPGTQLTWYDQATPVNSSACGPGGGGGGTGDGYLIVKGVTGPAFNPNYVWWFNGFDPDPDNYPETALLALPAPVSSGNGPFTWTVTSGSSELQFVTGAGSPPTTSPTMTTTQPLAEVMALNPSAPGAAGAPGDVVITVSAAGGFTYAPFTMKVKRPWKDLALEDEDGCVAGSPQDATALGYNCSVHYQTHDQFNRALPATIIYNENWQQQTAAARYVNWSSVPCGGACVKADPVDWHDSISASNSVAVGLPGGTCSKPLLIPAASSNPGIASPQPLPPQSPACVGIKLQNLNGGWWVGSPTPGQGVNVQTNNWALYLDHGLHTNIKTGN